MGNPLPVHLPQECRKAAKILNAFVDPVNGLDRVIPLRVLQNAKGFAIFSVFRIGFLMSARAGSGIVIARAEDGSWTPPAAIGLGGLGGGFNAGAEVTDFLIVLNTASAVRSFMATGSLQLGGNLSLAVGPLGRSAEASGSLNSKMRLTAMFSYSRSKGLYGGVSLEGTVLVDRSDANSKAYGHGVTAKQILSGNIDVPGFCEPLIGTIEKFTITGRVANARDAALAEEMRRSSLADSSSFESGRGNDGLFSDEEERAYERRRHDVETRNDGSYAFGSPMASITNTPTGMGRSGRERSGSTTYSNYGSYGAQDPFETRFEPSREREMDDFDRELQTPDWDGSRPTATRPGADSHFRAASYGGKAATPPPGGRRSDVGLWKRMRGGSKGAIAVDNAYMGDYFGDDSSSGGANRNGPRRSPPRARNGSSSSAFGTTDFDFPPRAGTRADTGEDLLGLGTLDEHRTGDADDDLFGSPTRDDRAYSTAFSAAPISSTARGAPLSPTSPTISTFGSGSGSSALYAAPATVAAPAISAPAIPSRPVNLGRVVALYDFEAVEAGDLGFERGDVITVTNKSESAQDWWQGRIMNREGRVREGSFPANYTEAV